MRKLKLKLIGLLQFLLGKFCKELDEHEYQARREHVFTFFHEILPSIDEQWAGKAIIENGSYNYYILPSGNLPKYDLVIPEIPLYVVVLGVISAEWPQAQMRGISRADWEVAQLDLAYLERETKNLATIGHASKPKTLIVRWNDPVNHLSLAERLQEK